MNIQVYRPTPVLQNMVQMLMIFKHQSGSNNDLLINPFPPSPQQGLFFYLEDPIHSRLIGSDKFDKCPEVMLTGPQLKRVDLQMGRNHCMLYVGFKPGALRRLTSTPMNELIDLGLDASFVLGPAAGRLQEQLRHTIDDNDRIQLVEQFLVNKLAGTYSLDPLDRALQHMVNKRGNLAIDQMAQVACLSVRQLERRCHERVGVSPKLFARLVRFSSAYRMHEAQAELDWASIAHHNGYFDQMHLIRDFKEFTGSTPKRLERQLAQTPHRLQAILQIN